MVSNSHILDQNHIPGYFNSTTTICMNDDWQAYRKKYIGGNREVKDQEEDQPKDGFAYIETTSEEHKCQTMERLQEEKNDKWYCRTQTGVDRTGGSING